MLYPYTVLKRGSCQAISSSLNGLGTRLVSSPLRSSPSPSSLTSPEVSLGPSPSLFPVRPFHPHSCFFIFPTIWAFASCATLPSPQALPHSSPGLSYLSKWSVVQYTHALCDSSGLLYSCQNRSQWVSSFTSYLCSTAFS